MALVKSGVCNETNMSLENTGHLASRKGFARHVGQNDSNTRRLVSHGHMGRVVTLIQFPDSTPFTTICRLRVVISVLRANVLSSLGCTWCTFLITVSRDYEIMYAYFIGAA